eukprot:7296821-Alexandrium_andersonii.AAC.2
MGSEQIRRHETRRAAPCALRSLGEGMDKGEVVRAWALNRWSGPKQDTLRPERLRTSKKGRIKVKWFEHGL